MLYYATKVIITALLIVLISEISKRSTLAGSILASIPLVSVLAMMWLYIDTQNSESLGPCRQHLLADHPLPDAFCFPSVAA